MCTTLRNVKEVLMILDVNTDQHKRMNKSTGNSNHIGKHDIFLLFKSL